MSPRRDRRNLAGAEESAAPLTVRQRRILAALVQAYIDQGEPVSSLWLAERGGFGVSSATLRHLLSSLEEA